MINIQPLFHHRKFRVEGNVHNVGFRHATVEKAQELGLTGFVRNQTDGTVYVEAEGSDEQLNRMEAWLKAGGPPAARVDKVETTCGVMVGFSGFIILSE